MTRWFLSSVAGIVARQSERQPTHLEVVGSKLAGHKAQFPSSSLLSFPTLLRNNVESPKSDALLRCFSINDVKKGKSIGAAWGTTSKNWGKMGKYLIISYLQHTLEILMEPTVQSFFLLEKRMLMLGYI